MRPSRIPLEERLRAEADRARRAAPRMLHERVIGAVRASAPRSEAASWPASPASPASHRGSLGLVVTLAAAAAVALFFLLRTDHDRPEEGGVPLDGTGPTVAMLSHELLDTVTLLERPIDSELRDEARNLLLDTSRAVAGVVRGLPAPIRGPLERL